MSGDDPTNAERQARYRKKNRAAYVRLIAVAAAVDGYFKGTHTFRQAHRQIEKAKALLRTHGVDI